jgi:hypothetical protein
LNLRPLVVVLVFADDSGRFVRSTVYS